MDQAYVDNYQARLQAAEAALNALYDEAAGKADELLPLGPERARVGRLIALAKTIMTEAHAAIGAGAKSIGFEPLSGGQNK